MNNDYPKMLYKACGTEEIHGALLATHIVNDPDEEAAALADGFHLTTPEAIADQPSTDSEEGAPPTRAELIQKATELGLDFKHNISNVKLAELVADAVKA